MARPKELSRRELLDAGAVGAASLLGVQCSTDETPTATGGAAALPGTGGVSAATGGTSGSLGGAASRGGASGAPTQPAGGGSGGSSSQGGASGESSGVGGATSTSQGGSSGGDVSKGGSSSAGSSGAGAGTTSTGGRAQGGNQSAGGASGSASAGASGTGNTGGAALVGLARAATIEQAVRDAIALTRGFDFIRNGDTVLLKPNLNSGDPAPYSTSPQVVRAVIQLARDHGARRIIVGDRSNPNYRTLEAMTKSGITAVVEELDVEAMNFDGMPTQRVSPSGATNWPNGFETYRVLLDEVDHIINLPCCKHHGLANFSMAMKAWMGIIVQTDRSTAHQRLGERLPELHLAVREKFVVLDASKACLTRGPEPGGEQSAPNVIVATADITACDVTGLAILKRELERTGVSSPQIQSRGIWEQPQIVRALQLGLGIKSKTEYEARASGVDEFDDLMKRIRA